MSVCFFFSSLPYLLTNVVHFIKQTRIHMLKPCLGNKGKPNYNRKHWGKPKPTDMLGGYSWLNLLVLYKYYKY